MYDEDKIIRKIIAIYFRSCSLEYNELFNLGYLGYLKAMKNSTQSKTKTSMKYVEIYVRGEILNALKKENKHNKDRARSFTPDDEDQGLGCDVYTSNDIREDAKMVKEHTTDEAVQHELYKDILSMSLSKLNERDRQIIIGIYKHDKTYIQLANKFGISPQRIGQIHERLLTKFRKTFDKN